MGKIEAAHYNTSKRMDGVVDTNSPYFQMMNRSRLNDSDDFFKTPKDAIKKFLFEEMFVGSILDPCCGTGTIPKMCKMFGYRSVYGSDIVDRGYEGVKMADFLDYNMPFRPDNIICNPPYKIAEEFFHRAYSLARKKVAMLLRLMWMEGQRRYETIFSKYPPSRIYVFSYRLSFTTPKDGNKRAGGMTPYAWFVWDKERSDDKTRLLWISKR